MLKGVVGVLLRLMVTMVHLPCPADKSIAVVALQPVSKTAQAMLTKSCNAETYNSASLALKEAVVADNCSMLAVLRTFNMFVGHGFACTK